MSDPHAPRGAALVDAPARARARRHDIFVSYRRSDSMSATGRLYERLAARYGKQHVFKDVDSLRGGDDFAREIARLIPRCAIVLVVIGQRWLDARDEAGRRRLDDPEDWVRREVELALAAEGVTIIPVMVEGAHMPPAEEVPEGLRRLTELNAVVVNNDPDFESGTRRLLRHVDPLLPPGMRPAVRGRRRALGAGGATLALALVAALVVDVLRPPWLVPPERLLPHWGSQALTGAVVTGPAQGWAVGTGGLLLQVNGDRATPIETTVTDDLYAAASGPQDAWAVGARGALLHLSQGQWTAATRATTADLYGVAEMADGGAWAVGAAGTILRERGGRWQPIGSPTWHALAGVALQPNGTGWAVGRAGTILRLVGAVGHRRRARPRGTSSRSAWTARAAASSSGPGVPS